MSSKVITFLTRLTLPQVQAAYGFAKQKLFDFGAEAIIRLAAYRIRRRLQQHHDTIRRRRPNSQRSSLDQQEADHQPEQPQTQEAAEQVQLPAPRIEPAAPAERPPVSFLFTTTLLFPFISSAAGSALLSLSEHSPAIRTLIGLRKDGRDRYFSRPIASITGLGLGASFFDQLTTGFVGDGRMILKRGWSWEDFEPVWYVSQSIDPVPKF
jgi:hypothetical protein